MLNVTVDEVQRDFLKYFRQVAAGEAFVIIQADKPIAELRPITSDTKRVSRTKGDKYFRYTEAISTDGKPSCLTGQSLESDIALK